MKKVLFVPLLFLCQLSICQKKDLIILLNAYKSSNTINARDIIYDYTLFHENTYLYDLDIVEFSNLEETKFITDTKDIVGIKILFNCKLKKGPKEYINKKVMAIMFYEKSAKHYSAVYLGNQEETNKIFKEIKNIVDTGKVQKSHNYSWLSYWALLSGRIKEAIKYNSLASSYNEGDDDNLEQINDFKIGLKRITSSVPSENQKEKKEKIINIEKIDGFEEFKLGKTSLRDLDLIIKKENLEKTSINSWDQFSGMKNIPNKIAEVLPDKKDLEFSYLYKSSLCKKSKVYFIPTMSGKEYFIKNAFLFFYNDTLIKIEMDYDENLVTSLKNRYKINRTVKKVNSKKCTTDRNLNAINVEETEITFVWKNRNIECIAIKKDYNSDCNKEITGYIYMRLKAMSSIAEECNDKELERIKLISN